MTTQPLILLTNDDGIESPGLAALAAALDPLGELLIVAPSSQQSGMGRSMPSTIDGYDGRIVPTNVSYGEQVWPAYGVNGTPAQAVQHAILELAPRRLALAASGINFGENIGIGVTVSGTVGAALEAAAFGIPALAISLQVDDPSLHLSYDDTVDFSAAMYFSRKFGARWIALEKRLPDVDVLKIDVPVRATPETPWRITRLARETWFKPLAPSRKSYDVPGRVGYEFAPSQAMPRDSDGHVLLQGEVSVTPLSLDITARVRAAQLHDLLNHQ